MSRGPRRRSLFGVSPAQQSPCCPLWADASLNVLRTGITVRFMPARVPALCLSDASCRSLRACVPARLSASARELRRWARPHVTGFWPWNLALEMAARWNVSLDGNHAAPPVADARVGPGGLLPPVPSCAVAPRCAREASAWHLSPHASHLLMLGTTPCPGRGWAGERVC